MGSVERLSGETACTMAARAFSHSVMACALPWVMVARFCRSVRSSLRFVTT